MRYNYFKEPAQEVPQILYCSRDVDLKPGIRYGPVIRNVYIFECCAAGYGSVIINGKEFLVGPGDCYILLPGDTVIHTADKVEPRSGVSCIANGLSLGNYLAKAGISSSQPFAPKEIFDETYALIEQMLALENEPGIGSNLRKTACLYHILGLLLKDGRSADGDSVIQRAIGIMETRYNEILSINDLAELVGLDRSYFSTLFKNQTGVPPHRYLTRLRVQKACALMDRDSITVSNVAESVGLDAQNFSRIFKREMGMTPMQYKQRNQ